MADLVKSAGYVGDFAEDDTVYFIWNTRAATGAGMTRTVDGAVEVYIDDGTTQITDGITDTEDFDGVTGQHLCAINLSASASYATGKDYNVVCNGMTIGLVAGVNEAIGSFSIENRTATLSNQVHGGDAAVLDLEHIEIDATGDNNAISATGSGSGEGISATGGATGHGISATSGGTSGSGIYAASGNSHITASAIFANGGLAHGLFITSANGNNTIHIGNTEGATGVAINLATAAGAGITFGSVTGPLMTIPELTGIADIPAEPSVEQALMLMFMHLRNNSQCTATERRILNDAGTIILKAAMSDSGGVFSQGKLGAP